MATIGNLGTLITFSVSRRIIRTFSNFSRSSSLRVALHGGIGCKQTTEVLGPGLDQVSFSIHLSATHGVRPKSTIEAIRTSMKAGTSHWLVIGGVVVGDNPYLITGLSEAWNTVLSHGELMEADIQITLQEDVLTGGTTT